MSRLVRDYSGGNIVDNIAKVESMEELIQLKDQLVAMDESGNFNRRSRRRIEKAMNAQHAVLSTRVIQAPPRGGIFVPNHLAKGQLLVGPDGKEIK